jgi:hypothetical protein
MTIYWMLRVGDGVNFKSSSKHGIWGIQSTTCANKHFLKEAKQGDILWFITSKSKGKIIAVATYSSHNIRELGPLVNLSMSNEELGWTGEGDGWTSDTEIHYSDLYLVDACELLTHIKGASTIRKYNEKCRVDLPVEYSRIAIQ